MKPSEQTAPAGASVLQRDFSLAELIDLESFREVCASYAELFQIGFKIFDKSGEKLVDVRGHAGDFCSYAFQFPAGKSRCMQEVARIRNADLSAGEAIHIDCFSGLRYRIAPIRHEGDEVGRLVYGPFRPQGAEDRDLGDLGQKFKPDTARRLLDRIPKVNPKVATDVVDHIVQIIEVMLYSGYKQVLTSRLHVETVTASYSELQAKNRQLRESYDRLKELDRLKSSFLATVSHELRTPLTSVIGYSEMLLEGLAGELNAEQREYIQTIMDKGENLLSLIASILDYSKVESGKLRLNLGSTDPRTVVESAVSTIIPLARRQEIQVLKEVDSSLPVLHADEGKLRQALVNILGNAVKFNKKGGRVEVAAERVVRPRNERVDDDVPAALAAPDAQFVKIAVKDTGIGIPEEKLNRVFDSFYQVDGSSTREYGGTGLGLAISHSYIQAHGGTIEAESQLGKGSVFAILLPLEPAGAQKG